MSKLSLGVAGLMVFIALHAWVGDAQKPHASTVLSVHLVPVTFIPRGAAAPGRIMIDLLPKVLLAGCLYVTVGEWIGDLATKPPVAPIEVLVAVGSVVGWAYSMLVLGVAHVKLLQAKK